MKFILGFSLIALAEMATFVWVGSQIGFGWALGLALITALLGGFLVQRAGVSTFGRIRSELRQGRLPGRGLTDAAAILVSGAFLISPGFITDTLGFLLLVPAVRGLVHRTLSTRLSPRVSVFIPGSWRVRRDQPDGEVIDVIDVEGIEQLDASTDRTTSH